MPTLYQRIQRLSVAALLSLGFIFVMAATVSAHPMIPAHATVLSAIPAIGSTITQAPTKVTVATAQNINPDHTKSNLFVYGPGGEASSVLISQGNATVSLTNPREMSVTIKPDPQHSNGTYVVRWITVSAEDGEADEGTFIFTVQPTTPTKAPTTTTTQASTGGIPLWVPIVVGVLALLIGLGGGLALGRRGSKSSISTIRKAVAESTDTPSTPTKSA